MNRILYENLIQYILTNQERFYRLAYSYTRNQEDALDAVQNAVCKALEAYEHIRNTGAIKTWFYRILGNESLQILKQRKKAAPMEDAEEQVYCEKAYHREDMDGELSLEERMGCGTGICMGCSCHTILGPKRVCKDGPVFNRKEIIW